MALLPLNTADEDFSIETREASPAHLLIKIDSFSLLSKHGIGEYESREFVAGDYKWKLIIYPDGDKSVMNGNYISVDLSMSGTSSLPVDWEVNAMFTIFLFNQISDNYTCFRGKVRRFHAMNPKWGFPKLISKKSLKDPLNGYVVDDNCVLGAEVYVIKSQRVIERVAVLNVKNPCNHNFVISEFSKLKDRWTCEEFSCGGYKWRVKLWPNGNGIAKDHSVSMYMECVDSKTFSPLTKIRADILLRIKNKNHDKNCTGKYSHWFSSSSNNWGYSEFLAISDMIDVTKGFLVNDCCFLEIEISITAIVKDAP